jgi:hypothetical protein
LGQQVRRSRVSDWRLDLHCFGLPVIVGIVSFVWVVDMILQITLATSKGARSILTQEINPDDASAIKAEFEAAGMSVHTKTSVQCVSNRERKFDGKSYVVLVSSYLRYLLVSYREALQ